MSATNFKDLKNHLGHKIERVSYGDPICNVAVECITCGEVLLDYDKPYSYSDAIKAHLKPGTQIIYVPSHADGPDHKDAEEGFVTSVRDEVAFCRYWNKDGNELRTVANSKATPFDMIIIKDTQEQSKVDKMLELIKSDAVRYGGVPEK